MRPDFVYFDLGNVLLYFDHSLAMRKLAKIAGITPEQMRSIVLDGSLQVEYETGWISGVQFVSRISDTIGRELDVSDMLHAAADMFIRNPHILPVLERIRDMEFRWDCFRILARRIGIGFANLTFHNCEDGSHRLFFHMRSGA